MPINNVILSLLKEIIELQKIDEQCQDVLYGHSGVFFMYETLVIRSSMDSMVDVIESLKKQMSSASLSS